LNKLFLDAVPVEVIHRQFAEPGELKKELEEQLVSHI